VTVQVIIDWFSTSAYDDRTRVMQYSMNEKVTMCKANDLKRLEGRVRLSTGVDCFILCDEMHEWFMKVDPRYRTRVSLEKMWVNDARRSFGAKQDRCAFVLNFREASFAMLFKLSFGGSPRP
jgi:hypothetical protein